jgi:hypothetical protein
MDWRYKIPPESKA